MTDARKITRQIFAIASVTFNELLREKILWSSFVFALFCIGLAYAVSQVSFADNARIALDFGLASISIVGGLISVIMGSSLIAKEVQNRTLYLILSKSIWRWQFVSGRFIGLLAILFLNSLLMTGVVLVVVKLSGGGFGFDVAKSLMLQMVEFGLLAAVACVFSSMSTATLAAIFSSGIWVIGHAIGDLRVLSQKIEPVFLRPVLQFVSRVLPDLTRFDIKAEVSHHLPVLWSYTLMSTAYGAAYIAFALVAACLIFSRREL